MKKLSATFHASLLTLCLAACVMMFFPFVASAQRPPIGFHNLNSSSGLCSNYVKGITQDHRGCLWVATEAGLARFDGSRFTTFRRSTSQICSDELNDVYYDSSTHSVWVASQRDGISVYDVDAQRWTHRFSSRNSLATNDVTHLSPAADGGIWVTHYHLGVEHYDKATGRFTPYTSKTLKALDGIRSWVSCDDGRGHLLIGHDGGGMSVLDLRTKSLKRYAYNPATALTGGIPSAIVRDIFKDRQGRLWVGTTQGLALFDVRTGRFTTFRHSALISSSLLSDQVTSIGQTRNGDLWVCTDMGGVSVLPAGVVPSASSFVNLVPRTSGGTLSSPNAYKFFEDSYGNVWVGHYRSGLDYAAHMPSLFSTLPYVQYTPGAMTYKPVWGLSTDASGHLWMGGEEELCSLDASSSGALTVSLASLGRNLHVNTIWRDASGTLWLGLYNKGVAVFSPQSHVVTPVPMPRADLSVNCFHRGTDRLWIGTESGLYFLKDGQASEATAINSQLEDLMIRSILTDRQGRLWLGTFGRGIYVLDVQGRVVAHVENGNGLQSNAVNQLLLARDGSIWAATRMGLAHFPHPSRPAEVRVYGRAQGLTDEHVHALAQDAEGHLWLSTNMHIARFDVKRHSFDNFAARDGVPSADFVSASVAQDARGNVYFGSLTGVCRFNPAAFRRLPAPAPVRITGLVAYGAPTEEGDSILYLPLDAEEVRVAYDQNTIRLTFNVTDVAQSPLVEYAYCVDEFGRGQWLSTQGENYVTFRDLAPGTYTLRVRSRMAGQDWSRSEAVLRIVVTPPFWLAWYAKFLYALFFVLVIWWFMRSYKHKTDLESRLRVEHHRHMNDISLNQERLRFYTNITHELRTPLTLIVGPLDDLATDGSLPAQFRPKFEGIRRSANRLLGLVNELLEFRKTETQNRRLQVIHADLAQEVREVVIQFKELNRQSGVSITTSIEDGSYIQWFDPEIVRIALDNFLSNALKYTPEGEVRVSLSHEWVKVAPDAANPDTDGPDATTAVQRTVIRVADTGYGIPEDALPHLFQRYYQAGGPHQVSGSGIGLALVKSVAQLHHAEVSAANGAEGGSVFTFSLLTDEAYGCTLPEAPAAPAPASDSAPASAPAESAAPAQVEPDGGGEDTISSEAHSESAAEDALPTLLVVEDNAELREYVGQALAHKFRVLEAADGAEGLKLAQEAMPDVVVSDVMMPVMDGYELCRRLKADINTSHIPVILLTAKDLMQDKAEGYAAGADSYLTKPFSSRLLLSRIENLLKVRRQLAELMARRMALPQEGGVAPSAPQLQEAAEAAEAPSQTAAPAAAAAPDGDSGLTPVDRKFLVKLNDFVLSHLDQEKMDVGYIASEMCMSHSTLYRKIKALLGISVNEYVRRIRLRRAAELLSEGEHTIAEIADRTGFSTASYFRQCFKDAYGLTPSEYAAGKR